MLTNVLRTTKEARTPSTDLEEEETALTCPISSVRCLAAEEEEEGVDLEVAEADRRRET
jgi:hypothetical protein